MKRSVGFVVCITGLAWLSLMCLVQAPATQAQRLPSTPAPTPTSPVITHGLRTAPRSAFPMAPIRRARRVLSQTQNGSIIIMHVNGRGWHSAEALPAIIAALTARGFQFVTVSDLLNALPPGPLEVPSPAQAQPVQK